MSSFAECLTATFRSADLRLNLPADNTSLFETLVYRKIIGKGLAQRLIAMAGFRNILVHDYLEIDRRIVYKALKNNLTDFEKFIRAIAKLL